jgi:hypothetical protein
VGDRTDTEGSPGIYLDSMKEIDGKLWAAFEEFAKKYPDDPGARMTLELARWVRLLEEQQGTADDPLAPSEPKLPAAGS